jgi:hypothetical protein
MMVGGYLAHSLRQLVAGAEPQTYPGKAAAEAFAESYDLVMNRTANGMSAKDLQLVRRLLPFQNAWMLRRAINTVQGESAEALGLAGSDVQTFGGWFLDTKPLPYRTLRYWDGARCAVKMEAALLKREHEFRVHRM